MNDKEKYKNQEWLREQINCGKSINQIAKECGSAWETIKLYMEKFEIFKPVHLYDDKAWLTEEYINKNKSSNDIAKEVGVASNIIVNRVNKFGIKKSWENKAKRAKVVRKKYKY